MKYSNVKEIYEEGLCMGCGTCKGICPSSSIKIEKNEKKGEYFPYLSDDSHCKKCGLCVKVCPGWKLDFFEMNKFCFGKSSDSVQIGNFISCYVGYATNLNIRFNSTSGGIASALTIFALEEKLIDAVLTTRMRKDMPLEPETFLARKDNELIEASGTKYCPVALNTALKEISSGNERCAVVGLPCHIQGIRLAQMQDASLKNNIVLELGLFCYQNFSFKATETLLRRLNISKEGLEKLSYRTKGWPGSFVVRTRDGNENSFDIKNCYDRHFMANNLRRCILCSDALSEFADISLGDAWLAEYKEDKAGTSMIIARTKYAHDLILKAEKSGKIKLKEISPEEIIKAQEKPILFKKKYLNIRISFSRLLGRRVPIYRQQFLPVGLNEYIFTLFFYFKRFISKLI